MEHEDKETPVGAEHAAHEEPIEIAEHVKEPSEMEKLLHEARDYKEKYLHALAEGENARKRLQRERHEMVQHSIQNVIVEFLNPIDQMESALKYAENAAPEVRDWAIGFQMILTQFKDVLTNHGVSPFISEGHKFDPHFHEAIDVVITEDHPPGTIIKERVKGYKMSSGKVIRAARVDVAKAPEKEEKN